MSGWELRARSCCLPMVPFLYDTQGCVNLGRSTYNYARVVPGDHGLVQNDNYARVVLFWMNNYACVVLSIDWNYARVVVSWCFGELRARSSFHHASEISAVRVACWGVPQTCLEHGSGTRAKRTTRA
jgi:hypothetical protein